MNRPSKTLSLALIAPALLATPTLTPAAEWSIDPQVSARTQYDDNFRLSSTNELSVWEVSVIPEATFARSTEVSNISGTAGLKLRRFDENDLNTNDRFIDLESEYSTPKGNVSLDLNFIKDNTLDSEAQETEVIFDRVRRNRWSVSPGWDYTINETTQTAVALAHTDVSYPDLDSDQQFVDYTAQTASFSVTRSTTAATSYLAQLGATRSGRDDDTSESDNIELTLGIQHTFNARLSGSLSAGYGRTKTDRTDGFLACSGAILPGSLFGVTNSVCADPVTLTIIPLTTQSISSSSTSNNSVFAANTTYRFLTGELSLDASRDSSPFTDGNLILADRITLLGSYNFTSKVNTILEVKWYRATDTDDQAVFIDRKNISIRPRIRWKFDRDWSVAASYRYFEQEFEGSVSPVSSNEFGVELTYHWPKLAISR